MAKKLDFDVFALITPLSKPVALTPDTAPAQPAPPNYALRLANAIRSNRFRLPQVDMLGEQVTKGPSPVRLLHFGSYRVRDFALFKVISELEDCDRSEIRRYLWSDGRWVREGDRWIELDPPFTSEAERAFRRVFKTLEQLDLLERG